MESQQQKHIMEEQIANMESLISSGNLLIEDRVRLQLEIKKKVISCSTCMKYLKEISLYLLNSEGRNELYSSQKTLE
jgi:hypothetical protein